MIHKTGATTRNAVHDESFRFECSQCHGVFARPADSCATGYAVDRETDALICFACCGVNDARALSEAKPGARFVHYLTGGNVVSNWPGTLKIMVRAMRRSRNNWNTPRVDVWFSYQGKQFWGVQLGDSDILRIRALKTRT